MPTPEAVYLRNIAAAGNPYYVPGTAVTGTDTVYSKRSHPGRNGLLTYQVTADADGSGTLVGTFTVEMSNSTPEEFKAGTEKWTAYARTHLVAIPAINLSSGGAITFFIELVDAGAACYRLKFVQASGAGLVYANVVAA